MSEKRVVKVNAGYVGTPEEVADAIKTDPYLNKEELIMIPTVWTEEDIRSSFLEKYDDTEDNKFTQQSKETQGEFIEATMVSLCNEHDCGIGITWDVINDMVTSVIEDNE